MKTGILKNDKGVSLVIIALSIVVLFGFAALAVDVGHMYTVKNELQVAADAAALAGASKLESLGTDQTAARAAAQSIAAANTADVAYGPVDIFEKSPGANPGEPIPVALDPNSGNAADGDIVVGNWSNNLFTPAPGGGFPSGSGMYINAIKVTAKRRGDIPAQPMLQNWFAKVFSLLPGDQDFGLARVSSVAIAARTPAPILPIAVNEYWLSEIPSKQPYLSEYHEYTDTGNAPSFVRMNQVKYNPGDPDVPSPSFGSTFAFLGSNAAPNNNANSPNSYIDLDWRTNYHIGNGTWYYSVANGSGCSSCMSGINTLAAPPNTVNSARFSANEYGDNNFEYFFNNGYPEDRLIPSAVSERKRTSAIPPGAYPNNNYIDIGNDPSNCPYATIAYFDVGGGPPLNVKSDTTGQTIPERYPKGSQFIAAVYDGTHHTDPALPNTLTIVGYVAMEVDGYSSENPKNIGLQHGNSGAAHNANKSALNNGTGGGGNNTAYGHAISDIVEPAMPTAWGGTGTNGGDCDLTSRVRQLASQFGTIRLVDPTLKYGTHE